VIMPTRKEQVMDTDEFVKLLCKKMAQVTNKNFPCFCPERWALKLNLNSKDKQNVDTLLELIDTFKDEFVE